MTPPGECVSDNPTKFTSYKYFHGMILNLVSRSHAIETAAQNPTNKLGPPISAPIKAQSAQMDAIRIFLKELNNYPHATAK